MIGQYVTMFGDVISHVNISAVKSEDGGEYECKAISRAGEASHSARLNIYGELSCICVHTCTRMHWFKTHVHVCMCMFARECTTAKS